MQKKLKLNDLNLQSFVTDQKELTGGRHASCDCSLPTGRVCELLCSEMVWACR